MINKMSIYKTRLWRTSLFLCLIFCLSLTAKSQDITKYFDPVYGFQLDVPISWFIEPASGKLGSYTTISNYQPNQGQSSVENPITVMLGVLTVDKTSNVTLTDWLDGNSRSNGFVRRQLSSRNDINGLVQ